MGTLAEELTSQIKGLTCINVKLYAERSWSFHFDDMFVLNVQSPWRIVTQQGIALAGDDHAQQFGLPTLIDGEREALKLLHASPLSKVKIVAPTGDICLILADGTELQVFNNSSGYEGWDYMSKSGLRVVAMGGGDLTIWS